MNPVDVGVYHVELVGLVGDPRQHGGIDEHRVGTITIEPQCLG
jgi:hypothetical protein